MPAAKTEGCLLEVQQDDAATQAEGLQFRGEALWRFEVMTLSQVARRKDLRKERVMQLMRQGLCNLSVEPLHCIQRRLGVISFTQHHQFKFCVTWLAASRAAKGCHKPAFVFGYDLAAARTGRAVELEH